MDSPSFAASGRAQKRREKAKKKEQRKQARLSQQPTTVPEVVSSEAGPLADTFKREGKKKRKRSEVNGAQSSIEETVGRTDDDTTASPVKKHKDRTMPNKVTASSESGERDESFLDTSVLERKEKKGRKSVAEPSEASPSIWNEEHDIGKSSQAEKRKKRKSIVESAGAGERNTPDVPVKANRNVTKEKVRQPAAEPMDIDLGTAEDAIGETRKVKRKKHQPVAEVTEVDQPSDDPKHKGTDAPLMAKKKKVKLKPAQMIASAPAPSPLEASKTVNQPARQVDRPTDKTVAVVQPKNKDKGRMQDLITAALLSETPPHVSGGSAIVRRKAQAGAVGNSKTSKEALLLDAAGLTHEEMLVDRLYHSNQLQWLQEERGLQYKKGSFSAWEDKQIEEEMDAFQKERDIDEAGLQHLIFSQRQAKDDAEVYAALWRRITRRLDGRPNRAVRLHVRRKLAHKISGGPWTEEQKTALTNAVEKYGTNWRAVSNEVKRTAEHCRLRWREHGPAQIVSRGYWSTEEDEGLVNAVQEACKKEKVDLEDEKAKIPWALVSKMLNYTRTPHQCRCRWVTLCEDSPEWTGKDDRTLVRKIAQQKRALKKDDFNEVDMLQLTRDWKPWTSRKIKRAWRRLVDIFAPHESPEIDNYYDNLRFKLKKVTDGLRNTTSDMPIRRPDSGKTFVDEIDSSEERDDGL